MKTQILGHIDCPTCAHPSGMRITHDKNGHPFGYCEEGCGQQLRVGGSPARVRAFVKRYPWAGQGAAPVTVTEEKPQEPAPAAQPENPVTVTEEEPPKKRSALDDALTILGAIKHG